MKNLIFLAISMSFAFTSHAGKVDKSKTCDCLGEDGYIYLNDSGVEGGCISKNSPSVNGTEFFMDSNSKICGWAEVTGKKSRILGGCILTGYALFSNSSCRGDAIIGGYTEIENESRISAGARIFGGSFSNVRVAKGVRINDGIFSDETIDSSMSNSNITADEKAVLSKLGSNNGSIDYKAKAEQDFKALKASITKIDEDRSYIGGDEYISYTHTQHFLYYSSNGKCETNWIGLRERATMTTSAGKVPASIGWSFETRDHWDANLNTLISVNDHFDLNNSFESSFYSGDLLQRRGKGIQLFVYHLKLKKQFNFGVGIKRFGDTYDSGRLEKRNIFRFVFRTKAERDAFKAHLTEFVKTCSKF